MKKAYLQPEMDITFLTTEPVAFTNDSSNGGDNDVELNFDD